MAKRLASKNGRTQNRGITALSVRGFKSLARESRIEIRPLTLLAGANSSGKSSMMQPLLLLKQTLEATYDPGPLLLNGPNVKFTSVNQMATRLGTQKQIRAFELGIEFNEKWIWLSYSAQSEGISIQSMAFDWNGEVVRLSPKMQQDELVALFFPELEQSPLKEITKLKVKRERALLSIEYTEPGSVKDGIQLVHLLKKYFQVRVASAQDQFEDFIPAVIHIPGLRGNPERTYARTAVGPNFPGTFENYVASVIAHWQAEKDDRLKMLEQMLVRLGLTWKISAKALDDTQVELQVGRLHRATKGGTHDLVNIADVGFGVSQVLPVLVALLVADAGQLVYIEQPELHLHPKAQYAMAEILADAAKRGAKLVIETHSALLLLRVQTLVAEGELDPALIKLHWFRRNDEGVTEIQSADLDENGAFGDWPEDFADVELMAEGAYLDAVERRSRN